jgi:hypothetical protein
MPSFLEIDLVLQKYIKMRKENKSKEGFKALIKYVEQVSISLGRNSPY